jgi:5-methylcytosine-specific restriction endonuclease McrA
MKKICIKCGIEKQLEEFYKDKSRFDGLEYLCKKCSKNKGQKYYKENKIIICKNQEKYREANKQKIQKKQKEYYKTPRGKAALAKGGHNRRINTKKTISNLTHTDWSIILQLQNYQCTKCGDYFDQKIPTRDHIISVKDGGALTKNNVQALCKSCNSKKGTRYIDFRQKIHKEIIINL